MRRLLYFISKRITGHRRARSLINDSPEQSTPDFFFFYHPAPFTSAVDSPGSTDFMLGLQKPIKQWGLGCIIIFRR